MFVALCADNNTVLASFLGYAIHSAFSWDNIAFGNQSHMTVHRQVGPSTSEAQILKQHIDVKYIVDCEFWHPACLVLSHTLSWCPNLGGALRYLTVHLRLN